jgi:hypothetical protein
VDLSQDWLSQPYHHFPHLYTTLKSLKCIFCWDGILQDFRTKISRRPVDRECPGHAIEVSIANQSPEESHPKQRKFKAFHLNLMRRSATSSSKSQHDVIFVLAIFAQPD